MLAALNGHWPPSISYWLVMGAGYQLMSHLAARVDAALLNCLQRIQAGLLKGEIT